MSNPALNRQPAAGDTQGEPGGFSKARTGGIPAVDLAKTTLNSKEAQRVLEELRQLCRTPNADVAQLESAARALRDSGYKTELFQVLREALESPEVNPYVGAMWMRRVVGSNTWNRHYVGGMDELCERGEVGYRAVIEFLEAAGAKRKKELVSEALRKHAHWLSTHPVGRIAAARALVNVRSYSKAARWMRDWPAGSEAELPVLYCQALGLRGSGREKEAHKIVELALAKPDADQQFPAFRVWYAAEEALLGNTQAAADAFKDLKVSGWDDDLLCLYYLVRGVLRIQRAEADERKDAFKAGYYRVKDFFHKVPIYKRDVALRRQYRRHVWRMAVDSGSWTYGLQALWESADSPLLLLPLAIIPGLQLFLPLYLFRLCTRRTGMIRH